VEQKTTEDTAGGNLDFGLPKFLSGLASFSIKGGVTHKSNTENSVNRSGVLDITLHASEASIPEGLARVLTLLSRVVPDTPKQ
jgi:hypothetical protein